MQNSLETFGIYDSGSNVSLINSNLLKIKNKTTSAQSTKLRTINGEKKPNGMIRIKINIFKIEEEIDLLVVDSEYFKEDVLIGLSMIKKVKLKQDEDLNITQTNFDSNKNENIKDENSVSVKTVCNKCKTPENYEINFNEHINVDSFEISINHLNNDQKLRINGLIDKYKSIFAKDKYDTGTVRDYEARIDLKIDKYCSKRPYRCSIEDRKEIELKVSKLLEKNLIEESYSPFGATVTLAYKKEDGKNRDSV